MENTYELAVEKSINWWIEKSFNDGLNFNNGDNSNAGFMTMLLANSIREQSVKGITEEKLTKLKEKLRELLLQEKETNFHRRGDLSVDYDPNLTLFEAFKYAEINSCCLPVKTFTFIDKDNIVKGRYGYGSEWFSL